MNSVNTLLAHANGGLSIGNGSTPSPNGLYVAGRVGIGTASPQALLHLPSSGKLTLTTTDNFLLGTINSNNLAFDYNKIQARTNGLANTLQLNPQGGAVSLGRISGTTNPGLNVGADGSVAVGGQYVQPGFSMTVNPNSGGGVYLYQPHTGTKPPIMAENSANTAAIHVSNIATNIYWPTIYAATYGPREAVNGVSNSEMAGVAGVKGTNNSIGYGVHGSAINGIGVYGYSTYNVGLFASSSHHTYSAYFNQSVYVNGGVYSSSDQKLKHNVQDLNGAMELLLKLQPKTYTYRQDGPYNLMKLPQGTRYGLIAQDLEKVLPQLVKETRFESAWETGNSAADTPGSKPATVKNEVTNFKAVNYTELIPIMIKGMQEQQQKIEELERQLRELKENNRGSVSINHDKVKAGNGDFLAQNSPNPTRGNTRISYDIKSPGNAQLVLSDNSGKTIRTIQLGKSGVVELQTLGLTSGLYNYSLLVNGRLIETKRMKIIR